MRLLHVQEFKVKEFNDDQNRPPYAILSHTWGNGEVSFQAIKTPEAKYMAGYAKILWCCRAAKLDGFEYVWIDTCCIDQTSSSELTEAINSMFKWYKTASVCYALLSDVDRDDVCYADGSQFRRSRWFTRGWTLQELLAPEIVVFFNQDWVDIGTKKTLWDVVSEVTGISVRALSGDDDIFVDFSIAERMSWASKRQTTRVEDMAYSLMGIFDVNMPTLYGEGDKAFIRLQLEIIKESQDKTLLAWSWAPYKSWDPEVIISTDEEELLARSPGAFEHCRGIRRNFYYQFLSGLPFSMSNKGLHIWLPVIEAQGSKGEDLLLAGLDCSLRDGRRICIALRRNYRTGHCMRFSSDAFVLDKAHLDSTDEPTEFYIEPNRNHRMGFRFSTSDDTKDPIKTALLEKYNVYQHHPRARIVGSRGAVRKLGS